MARRLPWTRKNPQDIKPTAVKKTEKLKQEGATSPRDGEHPDTAHTQVTTPRKRRRHTGSRSPSTSPPPVRPEVQFMREGYNGDDVYMMVEDEFYSVAQSYTAHLHHAEYKRLMQKARSSKPKALPELSPSMSSEVKRRLQRENLERKQQTTLAELGTGIGTVDEVEDNIDSTRLDDPWSGTSLAGLMSTGVQHKTSLIGLERIPSMSRAAKGYSKGPTEGVKELHKTTSNTKSIAEELGLPAGQMSMANAIEVDHENIHGRRLKTEFDDGFSDVPERSRKKLHIVATKSSTVTEAGKISDTTVKKKTKLITKSKRSLIDELDDFDGPVLDPPSPPTRSKSSLLPDSKRKDDEKKKDRRSRLDEVPTFLI